MPALEDRMAEMVRENYAAIKRQRRRMLFHRTASAAVAGLYLLPVLLSNEPRRLIKVVLFLILPLAAIWFSAEPGSATGVRFGRLVGPVVTTASPGMVVRIAGWLLLLSPIIAFVVQRLFLPWRTGQELQRTIPARHVIAPSVKAGSSVFSEPGRRYNKKRENRRSMELSGVV